MAAGESWTRKLWNINTYNNKISIDDHTGILSEYYIIINTIVDRLYRATTGDDDILPAHKQYK